MKSQSVQWLDHIMWWCENKKVRVTLEWKPQWSQPRERLRKRWTDIIEENLKTLEVENWREATRDRLKWQRLLMVAKTLREYIIC